MTTHYINIGGIPLSTEVLHQPAAVVTDWQAHLGRTPEEELRHIQCTSQRNLDRLLSAVCDYASAVPQWEGVFSYLRWLGGQNVHSGLASDCEEWVHIGCLWHLTPFERSFIELHDHLQELSGSTEMWETDSDDYDEDDEDEGRALYPEFLL